MLHVPQYYMYKIIRSDKGKVEWVSLVQNSLLITRILYDLKRESRGKIQGTYPLILASDVPRYFPRDEP